MRVAVAPDRHGLAAGLEGSERHQPKASADNQPQTLTNEGFEQLIYDATTEFIKQVDEPFTNRARRSNSTQKTWSRTFAEAPVDYRGVTLIARCDLFETANSCCEQRRVYLLS